MKIKYTIIAKLNHLSAKEMDLFFYLCRRMDQRTGYVEGVYYRHVMKHTGMCKQSFYNALRGLEEKAIITVEKLSEVDYNVLILDNHFPNDAERRKGYVKLNRKAFHSKAFSELKAHEKYMLLEFLKRTHENGHSFKINTENLYKNFKELLGVSKRVIQGYLHNLRKFFSIGIKDGKYYITYLHSVFRDESKNGKTEENWFLEHLVKKECWRNHISYDEKSLADTAYLPIQYRSIRDRNNMLQTLMLCIQKSVEDTERKERQLQMKYVHKLLRRALDLPVNECRSEKKPVQATTEGEPSVEGNPGKFLPVIE